MGSWYNCVLVLEMVFSRPTGEAGAEGEEPVETVEVVYQVIKTHTRFISANETRRDVYFPSTSKSNKAAISGTTFTGPNLATNVRRTYQELLMWNKELPLKAGDLVHLNVYQVVPDGLKDANEAGVLEHLTKEDKVKRETAKAIYWSNTRFHESYNNEKEMALHETRYTTLESRNRLLFGIQELQSGKTGLMADIVKPDGSIKTPEGRLPRYI
jgi:hypothetical protein